MFPVAPLWMPRPGEQLDDVMVPVLLGEDWGKCPNDTVAEDKSPKKRCRILHIEESEFHSPNLHPTPESRAHPTGPSQSSAPRALPSSVSTTPRREAQTDATPTKPCLLAMVQVRRDLGENSGRARSGVGAEDRAPPVPAATLGHHGLSVGIRRDLGPDLPLAAEDPKAGRRPS